MTSDGVDIRIFAAMAIVFTIATLALGWYGYRQTKDGDAYLLGNRRTSPVVIALSYGATFLSASAVIGFGGQAAVHGASLMWLCFLNLAVGVVVAFVFFGDRTRRLGKRLGASTFADLLGKSYRSKGIRMFTALLIIIMMPVYCAAVLKGGVNSLAVITGLDYNMVLIALSLVVALYVVVGGLVAVMYNDAMQAVIMLVGMIVILLVTLSTVGLDGFEQLSDLFVTEQLHQIGTLPGANGWVEFADFGSAEWFTVVSTFLLGVGIGCLTQPQLIVRFMASKDSASLRKSMAVGCIFIFAIVGSAYTCGTLCNLYFFNEHGISAIEYVSEGTDFIIPTYIIEVFSAITFGDVFVSLFLISLICASVSTISGLMHTIGAAGGYDVYSVVKTWKSKISGDMRSINVNRTVTAVMMVLVVVYCYLMPSDIIAKATSVFMGLTAAALLPTYAYALYSKNPSKPVAVASMATGTAVYFFWALFINAGTSIFVPVCKWITGEKVLFAGGLVSYVDAIIVALPVSAAVLLAGLLLMRSKACAASE